MAILALQSKVLAQQLMQFHAKSEIFNAIKLKEAVL